MTNIAPSRRNIIAGLAATYGLSACGTPEGVTPASTEGPFYPTKSMRRADIDNDLVKILGRVTEAGGEVFTLRGRIMDRAGAPLANHRVEIWQCDLNGYYMHPGDDRSVDFDESFQGFGHDITDETGAYSFRTIKPTVYPGRTPHIHAKVFDGDRELLTTQFYIKGHPSNAGDGFFKRLSASHAESVSMEFTNTSNGLEAVVDVVI